MVADVWLRRGVGIFAMTSFVAAGLVRLCVALPDLVYLLVSGLGLTGFAIALAIPDERWSSTVHRRPRSVSSTRPRELERAIHEKGWIQ